MNGLDLVEPRDHHPGWTALFQREDVPFRWPRSCGPIDRAYRQHCGPRDPGQAGHRHPGHRSDGIPGRAPRRGDGQRSPRTGLRPPEGKRHREDRRPRSGENGLRPHRPRSHAPSVEGRARRGPPDRVLHLHRREGDARQGQREGEPGTFQKRAGRRASSASSTAAAPRPWGRWRPARERGIAARPPVRVRALQGQGGGAGEIVRPRSDHPASVGHLRPEQRGRCGVPLHHLLQGILSPSSSSGPARTSSSSCT